MESQASIQVARNLSLEKIHDCWKKEELWQRNVFLELDLWELDFNFWTKKYLPRYFCLILPGQTMKTSSKDQG